MGSGQRSLLRAVVFLGGDLLSRILYVGTDRTMTEMTGRLLKRNGFDVQCAVGQEKAFAAICTQRFAVVIADLDESVHDGIQFCQKVAQYSTATKFLLISGNEKDEEAALLGGADDWLKKPYSMRILYARIRTLLRQ